MSDRLSEKCFNDFVEFIHKLTGISIAKNRSSMVEGRINKRLRSLKLESYEDYLRLVKADPNEQLKFIDEITTNETYFYRTPRIWEHIEKKVIPQWFQRHPQATFQAWSAAASSGEEAHTLGILCQAFKEKNPSFSYHILGTDISPQMVESCGLGEYSGRSIEHFKKSRPELFLKFLKPNGGENFKTIPEISQRLKFQTHNLFDDLRSKVSFDLVLIRNVLIYFNSADQEKVIQRIGAKMKGEGQLIIGESESLSQLRTHFTPIEPFIYGIETKVPERLKA